MEDGPLVYPDSLSDTGEDRVGLLNDNIYRESERSHNIPGNLQIWNKNPIFYVMVIMTLAGLIGVGIFTPWVFYLGIAGSIVLSVIGAWFAAYIWDHYQDSAVYTKWELFKMCFTTIVILAVTTVILYFLVTMSVFRFMGKDVEFHSFPQSCRNDTSAKLVNCIRTGLGVPDPTFSTGPIEFDPYTTSHQHALLVFRDLIVEKIHCRIIKESSDLLHFRCLSDFWGYPDDLVIKTQCIDSNHSSVWIHSQSRLGVWDFNKNDARVRLISSYISFPGDHFGFNKRLHDEQQCKTLQPRL